MFKIRENKMKSTIHTESCTHRDAKKDMGKIHTNINYDRGFQLIFMLGTIFDTFYFLK